MKKLIVLACLGFAVAVTTPAFAGKQQDKMRGCNKEAKADVLKGDVRRAFMKKCLSRGYVLKHPVITPSRAKVPALVPVKSHDK
ncbi:MAG: PsiF family protein [Gallionella sp.]